MLSGGGGQRRVRLYAEEISDDRKLFVRAQVAPDTQIVFGRGKDCDLISSCPWIDEKHIVFSQDKNKAWTMKCGAKGAPVYVNGVAQTNCDLHPGDLVWVVGYKFTVLPGVFVFNNPDESLKRGPVKKYSIMERPDVAGQALYRAPNPPQYFNRSPRFKDDMAGENMNVDAPPSQMKADDSSLLLRMGPALTSGLFMLMGGMSSIMGMGMMASNLIFPSIGRKKAQEKQEEYEARRRKEYKEYLDKVEKELEEMALRQTDYLRKASPRPTQIAQKLISDNRRMWDHRRGNKDYLHLRIGTGDIPLECNISGPQEHFDMNDDPLREQMRAVQNKERMLRGVPVTLDLSTYSCCGLYGNPDAVSRMTANMLVQLSTQYGYDELKICFLGKPSKELRPFMRLPHTWNDERTEHYIAWDEEEFSVLLPTLDRLLAQHIPSGGAQENPPAELVIVIADPQYAQKGVLSKLLFDKKYAGVHVITLAERSHELPRKSDVVVAIKPDEAILRADNVHVTIKPDEGIDKYIPTLVGMMENSLLDLPSTAAKIPQVVEFLKLFGVEDVASLNIINRWRRSNPTRSLAAPIGIDEDGEIRALDIHEGVHGPHGLIAGMTGSGKSELIMTYILSMAVNFSPEEVSFLLIDYKGGGMATAFKNLPHTAGIMTNLDGDAIQRAIMSVRSELKRRQRLFQEAENALGVTNMNINRYQQYVRTGQIKTPLSHLLIITDEFAELKRQESEFMNELISASRIGRSLGVHLILATQKPGGIVDAQIQSNTSWRLCLRVQDNADSTEMIKSALAAQLTGVGRFYMQTGNAGMLMQVQSGWTGAAYVPDTANLPACHVDVLDRTGFVMQQADTARELRGRQKGVQLSAVTEYIAQIAQKLHLYSKKLWLPPLEDTIPLAELQKKYPRNIVPFVPTVLLGEADDPENQRRLPVGMALGSGENALVYGTTGSGKAMFVHTVTQEILLNHAAREAQLYIVDLMGDGLANLADAPQVGDVLGGQDHEKRHRLLRRLHSEITRRRKLFDGLPKEEGLGKILQDTGCAQIVLIVHGLHLFKDYLGDDTGLFQQILGEGPALGISVLATATTPSAVGYKLHPFFSNVMALQLANSDDYMAIFGKTGGLRPAVKRGRGLVRIGKGLYEFQTASAGYSMEELAQEAEKRFPGAKASEIRTMPRRVTAAALMRDWDKQKPLMLPIGLDQETLQSVHLNFAAKFVHQVLANTQEAVDFTAELAQIAQYAGMDVTVLDAAGLFPEIPGVRIIRSGAEQADCIGKFFLHRRAVMQGREEVGDTNRLFVFTNFPATIAQIKSVVVSGEGMKAGADELLDSCLLKVRDDWKTAFVVCASASDMSLMKSKGWHQQNIGAGNGLLLGSQVFNQYVVEIASGQKPQGLVEFPDGYNVAVGKSRAVRVAGAGKEGDAQ